MVNSVSFRSAAGIYDKPDFTKPQVYTRPVDQQVVDPGKPKKKSVLGKVVKAVLATAVVAAAIAIIGNKTGVLKNLGQYVPEKMKDASWLQWSKKPVKAIAGGLDKAGETMIGWGKAGYDAVKNLFKKAPCEAATEAAAGTAEAVETAVAESRPLSHAIFE